MPAYRGNDGSVTIAGASVAKVQSWELNASREEMETSGMQDPAKTFTRDIPEATGSMVVLLDKADAAQSALIDDVLADTEPALAAVFLVKTGKTFSCSVLPLTVQIGSERGSIVKATINFRVSGVITSAWV